MNAENPALQGGAPKGSAKNRQHPTRTEYVVRWRRPSWSSSSTTKSRHVQDARTVDRFVARLRAYGPVVDLQVCKRECGPWIDVTR